MNKSKVIESLSTALAYAHAEISVLKGQVAELNEELDESVEETGTVMAQLLNTRIDLQGEIRQLKNELGR